MNFKERFEGKISKIDKDGSIGTSSPAHPISMSNERNWIRIPEMDSSIEENKDDKELLLENISIENATYLQNQEQDKEVPNFEVESIELATPELFVDQKNTDDMNQDQSSDMQVFEDYKNENNPETITETKDPEMFENLDDEKDFEIPAFLRRQKN